MREKLYVFDNQDNLITVTYNYITAEFEETVEKPERLTIEFPMTDDDAEHFVGGNQVAFRDLKGNFRLFVIREVDDQDGEATEKVIECFPAIQELTDVMIEEKRLQDKTAKEALEIILENSRWQVGDVAELGKNSTSFYFNDAYESLGELTDIWGGEIVDRIEIDKNKIDGRYIDIVTRKGENKGKRFEIGKDIKNISRTVLYYPKTALYGKGSSLEVEDDDGEATGGHTRKITFRDVVWSKKNGDPVDKPKGEEWVGDPEALEKHGIPNYKTGELNHRFGMFEDNDEEDPETLLKKTWEAVQDEKDPKAQYEMDIETFYGVADYEHEQVFLGDTGIARDKSIKPMIIVESRVMSWKYDIGNPSEGELVLGNILDLSDSNTDIDWVIDKVKDNGGKWDAGGGPITDDKFPDKKPEVPKNVKVDGLYEVIMLSWDFESTYAIANYEVYASRTKGFVPDKTNLVFRGKVGGYNHSTETNEKWYFRVRAVNTHGTASDYTNEYSASTAKINFDDIDEENIPDFIEHSIYKGDEAPNPKEYKFWINTGEEPQLLYRWDEDAEKWKPLAPTSAKDLGAVEIGEYQDKINEIVGDIADKVDAKWVDGRLVSKANKDDVYTIEQLDNKFDNTVSKTVYETDKEGIVTDLESHESRIVQTEKEIKSKVSETEYKADKDSLEKSIDNNTSSIEQNAKSIKSKVDETQYKSDKDGIVNDIKDNKSEIEQTAMDIKSEVTALEKDVSSNKISISDAKSDIKQQAEQIKQRVTQKDYDYGINDVLSKVSDNASSITQNAKEIKSKVTSSDVQMALDDMEIDGLNLLPNSSFEEGFSGWNHQTGYTIDKDEKMSGINSIRFNGGSDVTSNYAAVYLSEPIKLSENGLEVGDTIAFSFYFKSKNNLSDEPYVEVAGYEKTSDSANATLSGGRINLPKSKVDNWTKYTLTTKIPATTSNGKTNYIKFLMRMRSQERNSNDVFWYVQPKLEKGSKVTGYSPNPNDFTAKVNEAFSEIKQNADSITSKVEKNGVMSAIEQTAETLKIDITKVNITGDLNVVDGMVRIQKGVITNEMVAGSAKIDFAKIANVKVTNAMIDSVVASKIKSGILDAEKVMVRVKSDKRAVQIDERGLLSFDNNSNVRIHLGVRNLAGKGQSDPATIRFFSGKGDNAAGIGMNVNDTFVIGSSNKKVAMELYSGKNTIMYGAQIRIKPNGTSDGHFIRFASVNNTSGTAREIALQPQSSGAGYIGTSGYRWWRMYINHIHYLEQHKLSTRESKAEIEVLDLTKVKKVFDGITLNSFRYLTPSGNPSENISYGVITDESPIEILDSEGESVNQDNYIGVIAGALKYQIKQTETENQSLHERIAQLELMMNKYLGGNE